MLSQRLAPAIVSSARTWKTADPLCTCFPNGLFGQQIRYSGCWQYVIMLTQDRTTRMALKDTVEANHKLGDFGKNVSHFVYEDWDNTPQYEPARDGKGALLSDRNNRRVRHIKPTEAKKRLASEKVFNRSKRKIDDLASYIKFVQTHKEDFRGQKF